ncbi:pyridoxal phosphate-dependent transferase [Naematelia encephala]|uniref:Pyridoxal phosphate-dependent transferase n=1 Tax=Naematelia encephala TaxID=71784 RepID=A0A1Y2ASA6_9TREE|nr:pyridoxal phosphate-dependent transferase [Naematelia encephala]
MPSSEAGSNSRLSLQPPGGLPTSLPHPQTMQISDRFMDLAGERGDTETLISCLDHLSLGGSGPITTRFPRPPSPRPSSQIGTREDQRRIYLGPKLSDRATGGPDAGPLIERFSCLFKDQYNCKSNPKGIVSLGVAENFLMEKECLEYYSQALAKGFLSSDLSYGDSLWGSRRINRALASFYNQRFDPVVEVLPEHLITGVGCSAVLDQLIYTLMDEGEAVLLASPYYTGFDRDLIGRARVRLVGVHVPEGDGAFGPESLEAFEDALAKCKADGVVVRAVIVCNPQNPLGRTYPRSTLLAYAKFCEEKDLHLVSDEIYAMSVYPNTSFPDAVPFTSMMSLDVEKELGIRFDKARLHVVYGMSKDFCANGLRIGSLVSQHNPLLLRAMANTSMLMKISSPADVIFSTLLTDDSYLEYFISTNRQRLGDAQAFVRGWFVQRGVTVAPSNAGNFIWVDLGGKLGFRDVATEKKVFQKLLDGGVYIAPGTAYHHNVAGWYRLTFSVARDNLEVGLGKIESLLDLKPIA